MYIKILRRVLRFSWPALLPVESSTQSFPFLPSGAEIACLHAYADDHLARSSNKRLNADSILTLALRDVRCHDLDTLLWALPTYHSFFRGRANLVETCGYLSPVSSLEDDDRLIRLIPLRDH